MPWRIELLGRLRIAEEGREVTPLLSQKVASLLTYLALGHAVGRQASHPRELLIERLWPEIDPEAGRHNLRSLLHLLRRQLEAAGSDTDSLLGVSRSAVQLQPAVVTDVAEFAGALGAAGRAETPAARAERLAAAVSLYQGELLPGAFEPWVLTERQRLAELHLQAVSQLAAAREQAGDLVGAIEAAQQAVNADPLREEAHYELMRLYAVAGRPSATMKQYQTLERLLREELDEAPSPATQALVAELQQTARDTLLSRPRFTPSRASPAAEPPVAREVEAQRLVLVYRRRAQPDERLLKLLEARLAALGHRVFVDEHLTVGVEWAREIEREIWSADAVIPLLSEAAIPSEMLTYEIQTAREAAQMQGGRPRLLPVRVNYTAPLSEPLAAILDPLEYVLWQSAQDDEHLIEALLQALREPARAAAAGRRGETTESKSSRSLTSPDLPVPPSPRPPVAAPSSASGVLPPDSTYYVVRPIDHRFQAAIERGDSIVLVKGARQMGKSSLLARGLQRAREAGARVILTPFQTLAAADLEASERLLYTLAGWIADQLDRELLPGEVWDAQLGASVNFERYLRREALAKIDAPIVWGLDEVDRLFPHDCSSQVFGLFRSWHNRRGLDPTGPWSRLTMVMAYASEAHLFITDANQSPFNIGVRFTLDEFTLEQTADLNGRYQSPLRDQHEIAAYQRLLGGHPFLVHRGLREMATQGLDLAALAAQADRDEGIFGDHLKRLLVLTVKDSDLLEGVRAVLRGQAGPPGESFYRLRSLGILTGETAQEARLRCPLYDAYLRRRLL